MKIDLYKNICTALKIFLIAVSLLIINGCSEERNEKHSGFRSYLSKAFDINKLDGIYYSLYLDNCNTCLGDDIQLNRLLNERANSFITVILVGKTKEARQLKEIEILKEKFNVLEDKNGQIYSYNTGFFKGLFVRAKSDKIDQYLEVEDNDIGSLKFTL